MISLGFPTSTYLDLIWVDDATIAGMMEPGQTTGLRGEIPVISFKALLAMKLHALKDGAARDHKDLLDLWMLLRYSPNDIAESELRILCECYAGPNAYRQLRDLP